MHPRPGSLAPEFIIAGFRVQNAKHYTMEPLPESIIVTTILLGLEQSIK